MVALNGPGMQSDSRVPARTPVYLGALFLLWLAVYGVALFQPPLMDDADSVHAEAAREILVRHDWVTLHANGIRYLEKAPLLYWTIAASFRIFGIHDWSARLPLALGVLALLSAVYFLGRRVFGEKAGFYAALASGLSFGPFIFTRFLIPDILVGLWLILSFDFFLRTLDEAKPSRYSCWGLAVVCSLNVLTKGLIGLVFPLATIGLYLLLTRNFRHLLKMRLISSTCAFLLVAAPWHILAGLRNPGQGNVRGFFWFYFVNEQFLRYLNKRVPRDYGTVPLVVFWGLGLVWLFPWSSFLPQALARVRFSKFRVAAESVQVRARLILFLGAFFILFFFCFFTRVDSFVLLQLFDASGVLRAPGSAATRSSHRWWARRGRNLPCRLSPSTVGKYLFVPACRSWLDGLPRSALLSLCLSTGFSVSGHCKPVALRSGRVAAICSLARSLSRPECPRNDDVSHPAACPRVVLVRRFRNELVLPPPVSAGPGQLVPGIDERMPSLRRSHRLGHIQPSPHCDAGRRCDRAGLPTQGHH